MENERLELVVTIFSSMSKFKAAQLAEQLSDRPLTPGEVKAFGTMLRIVPGIEKTVERTGQSAGWSIVDREAFRAWLLATGGNMFQ